LIDLTGRKFAAKVIVKTTGKGLDLSEKKDRNKRKPYFFLVN